MQLPTGPQHELRAQISCGGCGMILLYPTGATNVRCPGCGAITSSRQSGPQHSGSDMAQLNCRGCRTPLMYPRGASQVKCSLCGAMNEAAHSNQLGHIRCGGCRTVLMYQLGAQSVKCSLCNHITPVIPTSAAHESSSHTMGNRYDSNRPNQNERDRPTSTSPEDEDEDEKNNTTQMVLVRNPSGKEGEEPSFVLGVTK